MRFPREGSTFPGKDEVVSYLERYAAAFSLPIRFDTRVIKLSRPEREFVAMIATRDTLTSAHVVVATGPYQAPRIPAFANALPADIVQLHSSEYRNPAQVPHGDVLVVGGANSGAQIAENLLGTHRVALSVGRRLRTPPDWIRATPLFWRSFAIGERVAAAARRSTPRGPVGRTAFVLPSLESLRARGTEIVGRAVGADANGLAVEGGRTLHPACVIWSTGYTQDHGWIDGAPLEADGVPRHYNGQTSVPGLYFLGVTGVASLLPHIGRAARLLLGAMRS